ncbi:MAG: GntR family transcriptional regulator [Negativicutes bacterium]|nr:GntR family transcriptional regulator [Negativicutes bacterium]
METITIMSAKDLVTEKLREAIYTGSFKPGEELIQEKISQQLGVSRMPVREAFLILENAGLIKIQKNKRAIVKEITLESITEHLEIRTLLECRAAVKACQKAANFDDMARLHHKIEDCIERADEKEYRALNAEFHFALWKLAESPKLEQMLKQLWFSMPSVYPVDTKANIRRNVREHITILDALRCRDTEQADKAVAFHIEKTRDVVLALLEKTRISF